MKTESFGTLEVGWKYIMRDGGIVKVKANPERNPLCPGSFVGDNGATYTAEGVWLYGRRDSLDLISRIVEPTTLTIQRWGVWWKDTDKLHCSILPVLFKTRQQARKYAATCTWGKNQYKKAVKVKVTYEVIE